MYESSLPTFASKKGPKESTFCSTPFSPLALPTNPSPTTSRHVIPPVEVLAFPNHGVAPHDLTGQTCPHPKPLPGMAGKDGGWEFGTKIGFYISVMVKINTPSPSWNGVFNVLKKNEISKTWLSFFWSDQG